MKAIGIPLTDDHDNCFGIVFSEDGELLGQHTSYNYACLEKDLKNKDNVNKYDYIFVNEKISSFWLFNILNCYIKKLK